jgi:hypothetical protein
MDANSTFSFDLNQSSRFREQRGIVADKSGGGDFDQNTVSPFGRKRRRFLIGSAFAQLLVIGVNGSQEGTAVRLNQNVAASGCEELGKNLCVLEVYSDEDFEEDEFLPQESDLLRDMRRFADREDFDDDSEE